MTLHRSDEHTSHDMNVGIPLRMPATDENPLQARVDELEAENKRLLLVAQEGNRLLANAVRLAETLQTENEQLQARLEARPDPNRKDNPYYMRP